ncbi:uncharacterized protein Bfra_006694 [Botrytis fragariae]|uniref:Cysteine-rich transmembrane CYSTM domain-containing protein n=1 Tax=Botrytis fragariae TaxID=1964551 RepID=A0A8H6B4Z2_9HELO|nr:uncharacterized protein Bfra_006694 [Botrytis fragariae]KAF5879486.1 hypothetical protein Bfra_006694 [Botrytis fragariae]
MVAANPRTTLHPAMIRQPPAAYNAKGQDFEMREPSKHANMSMSPTPTGTLSRTSSTDSHASGSAHAAGSVPVHQRGGGSGGLCCGICAGLACFECLECCC